ncbi:MAG: YciI family protein [Bacillota bacterium]
MENSKKQYIYIIKPIPRLLDENNWTDEDRAAIGRHVEALEKYKSEGRLILAGRTQTLNEKTFGIVIVEAGSEDEAYSMMINDPAVKEGLMTAELYPYKVAIMADMR